MQVLKGTKGSESRRDDSTRAVEPKGTAVEGALFERLTESKIGDLMCEGRCLRDYISHQTSDGISVVTDSDLMIFLHGEQNWFRVDFDETAADINDWVKKNDGFYYEYSAPSYQGQGHRDTAIAEAREQGRKVVVICNLG